MRYITHNKRAKRVIPRDIIKFWWRFDKSDALQSSAFFRIYLWWRKRFWRAVSVRFMIMHRGQEFNSFEEVDSKINELFAQGHHPLRIFNSQSAEDSNRKRAKADSVLTPIDVAKWRYAYISYRCVYYIIVFNDKFLYGDLILRGIFCNLKAIMCPLYITDIQSMGCYQK